MGRLDLAIMLMEILPRIGETSREAIPLLEEILRIEEPTQIDMSLMASAKQALAQIRKQYGPTR